MIKHNEVELSFISDKIIHQVVQTCAVDPRIAHSRRMLHNLQNTTHYVTTLRRTHNYTRYTLTVATALIRLRASAQRIFSQDIKVFCTFSAIPCPAFDALWDFFSTVRLFSTRITILLAHVPVFPKLFFQSLFRRVINCTQYVICVYNCCRELIKKE